MAHMKSVNKNFNYLDDLRLLDGKHGKNTFFNSKLILSRNKKNNHPLLRKKTQKKHHIPTVKTYILPPPHPFSASFFGHLLVGFGVQAHTRGVIQGLFQPADIKSSRAQKGEHPPGVKIENLGDFVWLALPVGNEGPSTFTLVYWG